MEGRQFGRYRLLELLGRGGMGEVWRAHDTETDRIVALKLLPPAFAEDEVFQVRFRREAHAAAGLIEPHVVPIHHYGEIDGRLYVDMRLIEGRDLKSVIEDAGPLEPARAVMIIEQVGAALNAAHKSGLVHRDVKPSNILVGDLDFAYLIDFGIARAADHSKLTGTGNMVGTWPYMAPERFSTGRDDARSDTYSLACVLYECLVGSTPFPGFTVEQQVVGHLTEPPPRPSLTGYVPSEFDGVIAKGMAKDPDSRYPTSYDLALAARSAITSNTRMPLPPLPTTERRPRVPPDPTPPPISPSAPTQYGSSGPTAYPRTGDEDGRPAVSDALRAAVSHPGSHPSPSYQAPHQTPPPPHYPAPGGHYPHSDPGYGRHSGDAPRPFEAMGPPSGSVSTTAGLLRSERSREITKRYAIPALVAVVVLIIGSVIISQFGGDSTRDEKRTPPPAPTSAPPPPNTSPVFEGTFTTSFGPPTTFDGSPLPGDSTTSQTWSVKRSCQEDGCIATASLVDGASGVSKLVFDLVDGRWLAVTEELGTNCHNEQDQRWIVFSLKEEADRTLTGEWREAYPTGMCSIKRSVTFTRTGDTQGTVADPASQPRRVTNSATSLFGTYRYTELLGDRQPDGDYSGQTYCLRDGQRCLSYLTNPTNSFPLEFSEGQWSLITELDGPCPQGPGTGKLMTHTRYPIPAQPPFPIQILNGTATRHVMSGCDSPPIDFGVTLERIG